LKSYLTSAENIESGSGFQKCKTQHTQTDAMITGY
jgi:hypothetical protein